MKKKLIIAIIYVLHLTTCVGGDFNTVTFFSIDEKKDTISFIRVAKDSLQKPTIVFCQGSLPIPMVVDSKDYRWIPALSNFNYYSLLDKYHFVVISMPNTPVEISDEKLTSSYEYKPNNKHVEKYRQNDYLEKYVERGNAVLNYLRQQDWVRKDRIIVIGHSQGSHISLELGLQNTDIYAVGCLSLNILGRVSQFLLESRNEVRRGIATDSIAQKDIEETYEWWEDICRDTTEIKIGNTKQTWRSFSRPFINDIVNLKMPVYVAYGTEDNGPCMCDLLPLFFELKGKHDYKMHAFTGCGHNFETILPDGKHDFDNMHWQDVIDEFIEWCENLK